MANYCIYHDDPDAFKSTMKSMKMVFNIPRHLYQRAAMAVCSCRRQSTHRMSCSDLDLYSQNEKPSDATLVNCLSDNCVDRKNISFIEIAIEKRDKENSQSAFRFLSLLKMASQKNFRLLEIEYKAGEESRIRRKKINLPSAIKLWQPSTSFGGLPKQHTRLRQLHTVPRHFTCSICESLNDQPKISLIEFDEFHPSWKINFNSLPLKAFRKTKPISVRILNADPIKKADMKKNMEAIKSITNSLISKQPQTNGLTSRDKHNVNHNKTCIVTTKTKRCINCLAVSGSAHDTLHDDNKCVFHPGFLTHHGWSCCSELSKTRASFESHTESGCSTGIHAWRYQGLQTWKLPSNSDGCYQRRKPKSVLTFFETKTVFTFKT